MALRLDLHNKLVAILGSGRVYYQPPANLQMSYPCIVYEHDNSQTDFADNNPYLYTKRYMVMVIDRDPDSPIPDKIAKLPMCLFSRHYTSDNLNHDVFNIYH